MASLKELAEILAERAGRQFDTPFNQEMKVLVNLWRSRLIADHLSQNRRERIHYRQYIEVPLEEAPLTDIPGFPGIRLLRSSCTIPRPLQANGIIFDYVGSVSKMDAWQLITELHEIRPALAARYTGKNPKVLWLNDRLYVLNRLDLPYMGVWAVWDSPQKVEGFSCDCGCSPCFTDTDEYPAPRKIQQKIIQSILATELKDKIEHDSKQIEVNADDKT